MAGADDHRATVDRVALARDPAALFEPVEDARHRRGVQPRPSGERARAERTVTGDQIEAIEVDVLEVNARADTQIEEGQLHAQRAQGLLDGGAQAASIAAAAGMVR